MDKHIATLEKVYSRIKEGDFYDDYDDATKLLGEFREAIAAIALMRGQSDIEETIQAMDVVSLADLVDAAVCLERCEAAWCGDEMELAAPRRRLARAYSGIRRTLFTAQDAIECALRNSKRGSRTNAECTTALAFLRRATKQSDDTIPVQPKDSADE